MQWTLLVPVKELGAAKSRLAGSAGEELRPELALAFAMDTVAAALACEAVAAVAVISKDPRAGRELSALGARVVPEPPGGGLNAALREGARRVRLDAPRSAVATLNADLPALRPGELARVLEGAAGWERCFLADAEGVGTTLLSARPGAALSPAFEGPSRARHLGLGAVELELPGVASVRRDVDTGADLRAAQALGVGAHTRRALGRMPVADRRRLR